MEDKQRAKTLEPLIRIGKNGLTEGAIEEIKSMLKKKRLIKIKMLKAFVHGKDKKELIKKIVDETGSKLVDDLGNVVVLKK